MRGRLEGFAAGMFASLARADQRAKGVTYLRGLLTDGRRKSMQPMGERLGVDHQGLRQFVSASPWELAAVRERLAARAVDAIGPRAWVVDDTGFPKDGRASPGVARQYSGSLGKVANCQIGVTVHAVTDAASCPLAVPAGELGRHVRARRADRAAGGGGGAPGSPRRNGIGRSGSWRWACSTSSPAGAWSRQWSRRTPVTATTASSAPAWPSGAGPRWCRWTTASPRIRVTRCPTWSRPPGGGRGPSRAIAASRSGRVSTPWPPEATPASRRSGGRAPTARWPRSSSPGACALPGGAPPPGVPCPRCGCWPSGPRGSPEPTDYWLSTLPADTTLTDLIRLAKIRWRIEHDYRELKTGLGLDHFEGRTWTG